MPKQPKIQLLHTPMCHAYHEALDVIEEALIALELSAVLEVIRVVDDDQAAELHFFASPTVLIDDEDIEPEASKVTRYGILACRPYFWNGQNYDFPPKELVIATLKQKGYGTKSP